MACLGDDGLTCCFLGPDRSVCQEKCPIPQGGTCSGIAGPIYGDCAAGLKCCPKPQTADWSTCEKKCYLNHGETCNGFAGPIYGDCDPQYVCCPVKNTADLSLCMTKLECAKQVKPVKPPITPPITVTPGPVTQ
ncbi:hypothetical protein HGRIS_011766 [Hohenbuehelia grisea]|uniref:Uncharacterized protein n=1 Tax=Hohenbuehelia grisea TaxID=104357 RepID=A0ABR3JW46_9AGAR